MSLITYAMSMAREYYDEDTFQHAIRVAGHVADNELIPDHMQDECFALALMHDLLEDTEYKVDDTVLSRPFIEDLMLITRTKEDSYVSYIKSIKRYAKGHEPTYWVKLADMKDHLMQTETLTDKLKEKYLEGLAYLL